MRKMKEVLRLYFVLGLSKRQVARSCSMSHSTVVEYLRRAELACLGWPLPDDIDDTALETRLFGKERSGRWLPRPEPEYAVLHRELRRKGVTPSVRRRGDSYDNALAETIIGLYKTEVIRHRGAWRTMDMVEYATLQWVDWFNNRRLLESIGDIPPAEREIKYYRQMQESTVVV